MPSEPQLDRLSVVLVATRNPLNIGAAARAMSNFGCASLRLVNPFDVAFREARSAVGASELLASARQYDSVAEAIADCTLVVGTTAARHRELQHRLLTPAEASPLIRREISAGHVALLFGSEKRGLSNDELSYCHWLLRIPSREEHPSLNLGQAVAVCLYELARATTDTPAAAESPKPPAAALERLTASLMEALHASGYLHSPSAAAEEKLRRLVRRMASDATDTEELLGMLRQILWKLHGGGK